MRKTDSLFFGDAKLSRNFCDICQIIKSKPFVFLVIAILFLFTLFLMNHSFTKYAMISFFVLLGFVFSVIVNRFQSNFEYIIPKKYGYLFFIVFVLSFSSSIAYLHFFAPPYTKPLFYYILIGFCSVSIFVISYSYIDTRKTMLTPFLLVLLSLNVFLSNYITFPNGVYASGDSHYQIYRIVLPIVESGNIPLGFTYSSFPLHQIYVALTSIIPNLEPTQLYLYFPSIIYTILGLFLYSFARRIFHNHRIGTICMLVYIISPDIVYHATHAYQFSYAAPIGIILLFLATLIYLPSNRHLNPNVRQSFIIIFILLICTLVWTHQFTSAVTFALLIILWCVSILVFKDVTVSSYKTIASLYLTIMLAQWLHISNVIDSLTRIFTTYYTSLMTPENYLASIAISESGGNFEPSGWIIFSNLLGIGLIFMLSVIGSLYGIHKKNAYIFLMTMFGVFIWGLVSVGSFIKMPLLLNSRLLTFFWTVSISGLASIGIVFLSRKFAKNGIIICSLLLFVIAIFNLGNPLSGAETSFMLGDKPTIKLYDTTEDLSAYYWITENTPDKSSIKMSESWIPKYYDSTRFYRDLDFTDQNILDVSRLRTGEYVLLTKYSSKGLRIKGIDESSQIKSVQSKDKTTVDAYLSHSRTIKIDFLELQRMVSSLDCIYSNGDVNINL